MDGLELTPGDRLRGQFYFRCHFKNVDSLQVTVTTGRALIPDLNTSLGLSVGRDRDVFEAFGTGVYWSAEYWDTSDNLLCILTTSSVLSSV